jgi:hypothetical protein
MTTRYAKRSHKFGIQVPGTVKEALEIDKTTNTTFWHDAIQKEMKNNRIAFKFLDEDERVPIGYKWVKCHMIFDVKMDFTRKARFVAGRHMNDPPSSITYSSVFSRDSVRIALLLVALNDVDLLATDLGNAYLNATPREKVYATAGPEFGAELEGRNVLIVRALYGLKSSGAAWRAHLANTLVTLGFASCLADPDVWLRSAVKPNGFEYYEYILVYLDDLIVISHQPVMIMKTLPDNTEKPYWAFSSTQYVSEAIKNVDTHLAKQNRVLRKSKQPMPSDYRPELDTTPYLEDDDIHYYQSQLSILRWMVELGRLDIYINVAILSSFLVQPRQGHLEAIYCIYGYLKSHNKSTMVFDSSYIFWNDTDFTLFDWTDFYKDAIEEIPTNAPTPRGLPVQKNIFVNADHAGNKVT